MTLATGTALRQVFGETLAELADNDPHIVVLDGDVGSSTGGIIFETAHPDRYLQMGIAEQNMVGVAAGLATVGFVPFVTTFACFAVARALDSIRVLVAQTELNVKIVGGYAGLLTGMTGKTHQIFDDIAIMRTLPNMVVLAPADEHETRQMLRVIANTNGPVYIQVTRDPSPALFSRDYRFNVGRAIVLQEGGDATLVSTGVQTTRVFEAADILACRGIHVGVLHMPTIKPIDEPALIAAAESSECLITVEEQSVLGGLGGAVAEVIAARSPTKVKRLGIQDTFGESGPNAKLLDKYRLSAQCVAEDVESFLQSEQHPSAHPHTPSIR